MLWVLHKFKCTMKNSWICLALLVAQFAFGQSTIETNAWLKLGHKSSLSEAWSLTTSGQYRSGFGMSNDQWLTELDFKKSLNKKWDIGTELRHYVVFDRKGVYKATFSVRASSSALNDTLTFPWGKHIFAMPSNNARCSQGLETINLLRVFAVSSISPSKTLLGTQPLVWNI